MLIRRSSELRSEITNPDFRKQIILYYDIMCCNTDHVKSPP